jgi:hypothetical protein
LRVRRIDRVLRKGPRWLSGTLVLLVLLTGCPADLPGEAPDGSTAAGGPKTSAAQHTDGRSTDGARLGKRFAECFAADSGCVTGLLGGQASRPATPPAGPLEPPLAVVVAEAQAYLQATAPETAGAHWTAFMSALESYQTSPRSDPDRSAANAPLVQPEGDFAPGCATWSGVYREVGSFATAADPEYEGRLTFQLTCPRDPRCGEAPPYRASIEITEPSPDGATGSGLWLAYADVPVQSLGNLLVAYADSDLYDTLALASGPDSWCVNRPPPCRSPGARAGEVLFAMMVNCSEGSGVLQWGTLTP